MQKRNGYYVWLLLGVIAISASCSTQKNTWASRTYHATTTRYNIYFNGTLAFNEGQKVISDANEDDFSQVIPLYPVSNHTAAEAATAQMDRTIEKCRKCIKLHSIKAKPKIDQKKRNDPKYQAFLRQREFNKYMWEAWILLGKAEFHKGDFLGSIGTFNYVARQYDYDRNIVAICQLWTVRAYAEMGWLYEAEEVLQKVNQDDLARKNAYLYAAVNADLKLKTKQYKDALPFVKLALRDESKDERTRYHYVLGQLYELQGDRQAAIRMYKKVASLNPSAEMDFSARIKRTELSGDITGLKKMAKQYKNRGKLDYVYGALGNIYLQKQDTARALENYQAAIDNSTQGGMQKATVLIQAGDLYYQQRDYNKAQPCYTEAVTILSAETADYKRISKRAETLDELIVEYNTVVLQDSLQHLGTLSEEEQLAVVKQVIADLEKAEQEALEKAAQAAREAQNGGGLQSVNTQNMIGGGGGSAEWYFYNPQLMRSGKQVFVQRWGNRPLEDNWRRISKATFSFDDETQNELENDSVPADSLQRHTPVTDRKDPQFYLQQIPKTEDDIAASNALIADALYNMIYIYQDKVGDQTLADETFQEFRRRFPDDARLVELYYMLYLNSLKLQNAAAAETYKSYIVNEFPESQEARIVSDPDYFTRLQRMAAEQDSLYETTYNHYRKNEFVPVKRNKEYAEQHYPFSPLMPKFLFLNAIAVAKTEGQEAFVQALREMVGRYPESETGSMAKDMLAMMNQGMESQQGGTVGNLTDRRTIVEESVDSALLGQTFSAERNERSTVIIYLHTDEAGLNNLLYQVALFNFSQFLIKDFDLQTLPLFGNAGLSALQISGFDSMDETDWYRSLLTSNEDIRQLLLNLQAEIISITETNYPLLFHPYTLEEYKAAVAQ